MASTKFNKPVNEEIGVLNEQIATIDDWEDITTQCTWRKTIDVSTGFRTVVLLNRKLKLVQFSIIFTESISNQTEIMVLPTGISAKVTGICGVGATNTSGLQISPRVAGSSLISSHSLNIDASNVGYTGMFAIS